MCIGDLDLEDADIIDSIFIKGMSWTEYSMRNSISRTTLQRNRLRALHRLFTRYMKAGNTSTGRNEHEGKGGSEDLCALR